ncbi:MAG: hypothetical protein AAGH76_09790 [Pseudomonadota bacterium]
MLATTVAVAANVVAADEVLQKPSSTSNVQTINSWSDGTGRVNSWSDGTGRINSWSDGTGRVNSWSDGTGRTNSWSDGTGRINSWSDGTGRVNSWSDGTGRTNSWSDGTGLIEGWSDGSGLANSASGDDYNEGSGDDYNEGGGNTEIAPPSSEVSAFAPVSAVSGSTMSVMGFEIDTAGSDEISAADVAVGTMVYVELEVSGDSVTLTGGYASDETFVPGATQVMLKGESSATLDSATASSNASYASSMSQIGSVSVDYTAALGAHELVSTGSDVAFFGVMYSADSAVYATDLQVFD